MALSAKIIHAIDVAEAGKHFGEIVVPQAELAEVMAELRRRPGFAATDDSSVFQIGKGSLKLRPDPVDASAQVRPQGSIGLDFKDHWFALLLFVRDRHSRTLGPSDQSVRFVEAAVPSQPTCGHCPACEYVQQEAAIAARPNEPVEGPVWPLQGVAEIDVTLLCAPARNAYEAARREPSGGPSS